MFQTTITSQNIEIDKKLNDYLNKRLNETLRFFKNVLGVHIILSKQKNQYCTEITVNGEGFSLHANRVNSGDVCLSIDGALDKIEGQLKRHKEKRISRKRRKQSPSLETMVSVISPKKERRGLK